MLPVVGGRSRMSQRIYSVLFAMGEWRNWHILNQNKYGSRQARISQSVGMADKHGSEPCARKGVGVQLSPLAQRKKFS